MHFSKSFGYALRGVLYAAASGRPRVCVEEVADHLRAPRHFMGKVMKALVKNKILDSSKGPSGGFYVNEKTLDTTLLIILEITDGQKQFDACVLRFSKCDSQNPCPLHHKIQPTRTKMAEILAGTRVRDLLDEDAEKTISALV